MSFRSISVGGDPAAVEPQKPGASLFRSRLDFPATRGPDHSEPKLDLPVSRLRDRDPLGGFTKGVKFQQAASAASFEIPEEENSVVRQLKPSDEAVV